MYTGSVGINIDDNTYCYTFMTLQPIGRFERQERIKTDMWSDNTKVPLENKKTKQEK